MDGSHTILVTGATGTIGRPLVDLLADVLDVRVRRNLDGAVRRAGGAADIGDAGDDLSCGGGSGRDESAALGGTVLDAEHRAPLADHRRWLRLGLPA
jgi:nucleoside-diphosphate-sugar epimerase